MKIGQTMSATIRRTVATGRQRSGAKWLQKTLIILLARQVNPVNPARPGDLPGKETRPGRDGLKARFVD